MRVPEPWSGIALNQAAESDNKIHSDEVAKKYGFGGGLVPGITVFAYLVHPAIEVWGLDWLERGASDVVLRKPLYDGGAFHVEVEPDGSSAYRGRVLDADGQICADGRVSVPDFPARPVKRRGDPPAPTLNERPEATRETFERLREQGMGSARVEWHMGADDSRYTRDLEDMPLLVRPDQAGFANPGFALGLANGVLDANARLDAWIHAQSEIRNYAAIPLGATLIVEGEIADLFERGGHQFVDLDVAAFLEPDTLALSVRHRAIYRLREP
jgi:hypothetical protein